MEIDIIKAPDFRSFLQNELTRRIKANPRFSLRAFASQLDVQSGFLSKILLGQRRVTQATIRRFGSRLGLSLQEIDQFIDTAERSTDEPDLGFRQIAYDHFQLVSDWYHFAILELAGIQTFHPETRWIARALGISMVEAQGAIDRLVRLKLISINPDGRWTILEQHTTTLGEVDTAEALRRMQKQILEKSIAALDSVSVERRDQSSMTMAVDSSRIPAAKQKIKNFRRSLCAFLEDGDNRDAVYQLSISLFPLTKGEDLK